MSLAKRLSEQIREGRRKYRRNNLLNNLPFELSMESLSEIDKFHRRQDKDRVKQFNDDVVAWTINTTRLLKQNVRAMVREDKRLSQSISPNIYYDRKYTSEVNRIGFSFAREGVYIHKGAGKGQGGVHGSNWVDRFGRKKQTLSTSLGKQGYGNRHPIEWFNPVIEAELEKLADIVANYSSTMQIDSTQIFISQ